MTKKRFEKIKQNVAESLDQADKIMTGDFDNYDGADGAREVQSLCGMFAEVLAALENSGAIVE
jgi:hypothetical protein